LRTKSKKWQSTGGDGDGNATVIVTAMEATTAMVTPSLTSQ